MNDLAKCPECEGMLVEGRCAVCGWATLAARTDRAFGAVRKYMGWSKKRADNLWADDLRIAIVDLLTDLHHLHDVLPADTDLDPSDNPNHPFADVRTTWQRTLDEAAMHHRAEASGDGPYADADAWPYSKRSPAVPAERYCKDARP